jgi:hypothetical protein
MYSMRKQCTLWLWRGGNLEDRWVWCTPWGHSVLYDLWGSVTFKTCEYGVLHEDTVYSMTWGWGTVFSMTCEGRALLSVEGFADPANHGADQRRPHLSHQHQRRPQQRDHQAPLIRPQHQQWVRNKQLLYGSLVNIFWAGSMLSSTHHIQYIVK